jgi:hypothetical protein
MHPRDTSAVIVFLNVWQGCRTDTQGDKKTDILCLTNLWVPFHCDYQNFYINV